MGPGPGAGYECNPGVRVNYSPCVVRVGDSPRVGGGGLQSGQDGCTGGTVLDVTDSESQQSQVEEDEEEGYLIPPKRKRIATAPVWECGTKVEGGAQCKISMKFDNMAVKVKNDLKNEIVNDVKMSDLKTI